MADGSPVGSVVVGTERFDVYIGADLVFKVDINGTTIWGDSHDALVEKIRKTSKKQKLEHSIQVILKLSSTFDTGRYVRATLRGMNVRTHQGLFTMANGAKVSLDRAEIVMMGDAITDAELRELNDLEIQAKMAMDVVAKKIKQHTIHSRTLSIWSLIQAAEEAIEKGLSKP